MAFGRNKKARADDAPATPDETQPATSAKRAGGNKRKSQTLLSSVVNESAIGAAIDVLKRNDAFALPNGNAWVGLLLNTDDIGGLSQKQKGDATKGSIIQLIEADKIEVVATKVMLDDEFLGIVPTLGTLSRMDEYSLLTEAKYHWVLFHTEDGETLQADAGIDVPASYAAALSIAKGETTLAGVLPEVWKWGGGTEAASNTQEREFENILVGAAAGGSSADSTFLASAPSVSDADPMAEAVNFGDDSFDYASLAGDGNDLDLASGEVIEPEAPEPALDFDPASFEAAFATPAPTSPTLLDDDGASLPWAQDDDAAVGDPSTDEDAQGYYQYLETNKDRVVDEDEVRETILRRFLSDDLDLVVDVEEFDKVFATDAPAIALEIAEDPSDWLGSQVAQLSRQANAELAHLHQGNTDELRELFVETMALHIERTMTAVSTETPGSQYHALFEGAKRDFEALRAAGPQEVAARREEIRSEFRAAADARAEAAAAHARATYEDRNRPKLERDLAEAGLELDRRNEEQYAHDRQTVLEMRRKDAHVRMDVGTNRIFELLRERQADQREGERALLERWNGRLIQFIDENRKDDIARSVALAEELARTDQVSTLKAAHAAELEAARAEAAGREERLQQELSRNRADALAILEERQRAWNTSIEVEQERTRAGSAVIDTLRAQINDLGVQYENKYQARISELEADKQSYSDELDRAHAIQKRATYILVGLAIVIAIAGVLIGVTVGISWAQNQAAEAAATTPGGFISLGSLLH